MSILQDKKKFLDQPESEFPGYRVDIEYKGNGWRPFEVLARFHQEVREGHIEYGYTSYVVAGHRSFRTKGQAIRWAKRKVKKDIAKKEKEALIALMKKERQAKLNMSKYKVTIDL